MAEGFHVRYGGGGIFILTVQPFFIFFPSCKIHTVGAESLGIAVYIGFYILFFPSRLPLFSKPLYFAANLRCFFKGAILNLFNYHDWCSLEFYIFCEFQYIFICSYDTAPCVVRF